MRVVRPLVGVFAVSLFATTAACSSGPAHRSSPSAAVNLSAVCPATVVVQTDWDPETTHAAIYHLIGPGYSIDSVHKRVSGPLVIGGTDTGVKIEVRAGGTAVGFQNIPTLMYRDKAITLGQASTDLAILTSAFQPVTAVVSPLTKNPEMLMWDPARHPDWTGIADIGKSGVKVLISSSSHLWSALLVNEGLLKPSQIDTSYTGNPTEFITNPVIAQQGFATYEPFYYEHELPQWNKPVSYQLLTDVGYNAYPESLSVRSADLGPLSPCLRKLVPILQKSQVEYINDPTATTQLITAIVQQYNDGWVYNDAIGTYALQTMKSLKIVANDTSGPLGGTDPARVQSLINTFTPIITAQGGKVKPGLTASDIATNQFTDKTIVLG